MIRVLIADDHGMVRSGLRMLMERQSDVRVVAEAGDGVEALEKALAERPDVAVLDVSMPRITGLQAAREIRAHDSDTGLVMLSMHDDDRYFLEALDAGATGYVLKKAADHDLVDALRRVAGARSFLSSKAQRDLLREWRRAPRRPTNRLPARAGSGQADRRGPHQPPDRRHVDALRERPWSPIEPTCSPSSECATACSSSATPSAAG